MNFLIVLVMNNILVALMICLLLLVFILFMVHRKKNNKHTLEASKSNVKFTEEFKKLVGNVDLTLKENNLEVTALEDIEETLRALKELYEKEYISQDEYQTRTDAIIQSLDTKNGS
jgi:hypothetical protein